LYSINLYKEVDMAERRRNEKEEEKREKEDEKRSEKSWDEKWRHNPVRAVTLAIILIWGGIVALISVGNLISMPKWWEGWPVFLVGTGVILLIKAAIRMMPEHRRSVGGTVIIGIVLIGVGLGDLLTWSFIWPVILIVIGLVLIIGIFFRRR
jgi:hypothetical protein